MDLESPWTLTVKPSSEFEIVLAVIVSSCCSCIILLNLQYLAYTSWTIDCEDVLRKQTECYATSVGQKPETCCVPLASSGLNYTRSGLMDWGTRHHVINLDRKKEFSLLCFFSQLVFHTNVTFAHSSRSVHRSNYAKRDLSRMRGRTWMNSTMQVVNL